MAEYENTEKVLENQLHQQFAENDNNRIGTFLSFIAGLITLLGVYGYVFANISTDTNTDTNCCNVVTFSIQVFLLLSFVTLGILCFFSILALNLGYSSRRDQFIIYRIRLKRYNNDKKEMEKIFGGIYSPFGKGCCDFIPGFYNIFYWLFFVTEIFIGIITFIKAICTNIFEIPFCLCSDKFYFYLFLSGSVFILLTLIFRCCYLGKYSKDQYKFLEQENTSKNGKHGQNDAKKNDEQEKGVPEIDPECSLPI